MNIEKVIDWFKAAKPNPTEKDKATQIGAHFEEVAEMMQTLSCNSAQAEQISQEFYVCDAIDKNIDGDLVDLPENWEIVKGENYFKPDLAKFLKAGENE